MAWATVTGWLNYVVGNGDAFLTPDRSKCVISSPRAQEATQFLVDLIHKQRVVSTSKEVAEMGDEVDGVIAGKLSMGTFGDWKFSDFTKKNQGVNWDVTYIAKSPSWTETVAVFDPILAAIFENREAVRDGLTKMQDEVNALFARAGR